MCSFFKKRGLLFTAVLGTVLGVAALLLPQAGFSAQGQGVAREIRIADGTGDWGYPNPFGHYLRGPGFGYRLEEMKRELPERAA